MRQIPDVPPGDAVPELMHRLRNPLAALSAGISLVRHTARASGETLKLLDLMDGEVGRLDAATRETQRYFRMDAGRPGKVCVAEMAGAALAETQAEATRARVEIVLAGDDEAAVTIDRGQLLYALVELMSNACRHSHPGDRIRVSWRAARNGRVAVAVSDSGAGVPASHVREVGRPYFTTSPERTGLGVATVARVCRLAGGALRWGGVAGGGCRFTMELPSG